MLEVLPPHLQRRDGIAASPRGPFEEARMLILSLMLMTAWLGAQLFDLGMGNAVHVFGVSALLLVLAHKRPRERRV